jgi:cytohesin
VGEAELEPPEANTDGLVAVLLMSGELPLPPLHSAALADDEETIRLLLERGADLNQWAYAGLTPLHVAVVADSPAAVGALLDAGADPNVNIDAATGSPLALATALQRDEVLQELQG